MDARIEKLRAWGCDIEGAMARTLNDEAFYIECLADALHNPNFEGLEKALSARDAERAFDCAHALKGVLSIVGLTPMHAIDTDIVEPLRLGRVDGLEDKLADLKQMRKYLAEVLNEQ